VREAVLRALGKIAEQGDSGLLMNGLLKAQSETEVEAATAGLSRLKSGAVDAAILNELATSRDRVSRLRLIRLLDERTTASGVQELLTQAGDADPQIRVAALQALRSVVGPDHLPALMAVTKTFKDGQSRAAAESALMYASTRAGESAKAGDLLLAELERSTDPLDQASWIRALTAAGHRKALPAIAKRLRDPNAWLANATLDQLAAWPDPAPVGDLLRFAQSQNAPALRTKALSAATGLATTAGNARQATAANVTDWFRRADALARSEGEKKVVIAALARWTDAASVRLLLPYLENPALRQDAALAITAAAALVAESSESAMLKPVLDQLSGFGGQVLQDRISVLRRSIAAAEASQNTAPQH
jgi:hypothetical protein